MLGFTTEGKAISSDIHAPPRKWNIVISLVQHEFQLASLNSYDPRSSEAKTSVILPVVPKNSCKT